MPTSPLTLPEPTWRFQLSSTLCTPPPAPAPAAEGTFWLSDLLTAAGQTLTLRLTDAKGLALPGCNAVLSAEQLANTNAVVGGVGAPSGWDAGWEQQMAAQRQAMVQAGTQASDRAHGGR